MTGTTDRRRNLRLLGLFTLRSPLSHIGETISTVAYLNEEPIIQPDGMVERCFTYNGNAWRGQLRDLAAAYLLERLGDRRVNLEVFHLLFSGGRIGGEQTIDVARARQWRRVVPMFALWGGGVGNQVLPGKLRVGSSYPVCQEAIPVLPYLYRGGAEHVSYRSLTFEKSFSRKDDSKDDRLNGHIRPAEDQQVMLLADGTEEKKTKRDGPADQMRMTVELVAAGTRLAHEIDLLGVSEVELGCFVSALHTFARSPFIGGQANKGHGRVELDSSLYDLDTGEVVEFLRILDGPALLAPPAEAAKQAYDAFLHDLYDAYLADRASAIRQLLGA